MTFQRIGRSLWLLMTVLLLATLLCGCGEPQLPTPPKPRPQPPSSVTLIENGENSLGLVIVCDKDDSTASRRATQVRAIVQAQTGAKLTVSDDAEEGTYEIAVMSTSRELSEELSEQVVAYATDEDMRWGFLFDGKRLAIYATDDVAWQRCMTEFTERFFQDGQMIAENVGDVLLSCLTRADYELELLRKQTYLDPIFTSGAVLQRDCPVRLYGTGIGRVQVEFRGEVYEGVTEGNTFTVTLPPTPAGGPYTLKVNIEGEETELTDILFGEVILLAGQSNAELPLSQTDTPTEDYASNSRIRTYYVGQHFTDKFHYTNVLDNRWAKLNESEAAKWCAIAYHLGRKIEAEQDVPVGILCVVRGATVIQSFMPPEAQAHLTFEDHELSSSHPCNTTVERYQCFNQQGMMYEKMFKKVAPYTVGSVVWYQGESNTGSGESLRYDELLAAMIAQWRTDLKNDELPFIIVKIHLHSTSTGWENVRQAQERAAKNIPYCTLVDLDSLGFCSNIHPQNKEAVCDLIYDAFYSKK